MEPLDTKDSVDRRYTALVKAQVARGRRPSDVHCRDGCLSQVISEWQARYPGAPVPDYVKTLGEPPQPAAALTKPQY